MKEFNLIRNWASERGIYNKGDVKTQYVKFQEEAGELAKSIMKDDLDEFIDAIGDCVVVLVNLAELGNKHFDLDERKFKIDIESCIQSAYEEISNRKGRMVNGTFVKDETV
jgi:NTP pyrophosphatase (non-canonical NTP hydrolase)